MTDFEKIIRDIETLEKKVESFAAQRKLEKNRWNKHSETIMDKLVFLGVKLHDTIHECECKPDEMCPVYKRSMLRRVRRALRYDV